MANYWLAVTNEENWHAVKKNNIWGVSDRNKRQIEKVRSGDLVIFYVIPQTIRGVFTATSECFESEKQIFQWGEFGKYEIFSHRIQLKPLIVLDKPIQVRELIPKLGFITNKEKWSGHFRKPMRTIPKEDYGLIVSLLKKEA